MPYLKEKDRERYTDAIVEIEEVLIERFAVKHDVAGDMNYIITEIMVGFFNRNKLNYSRINMFMGALECCKLELYRRLAAPYEDEKIKENGDVYDD